MSYRSKGYQKRKISPETRPIRTSGLGVSYWSPYWQKWIYKTIVKPTPSKSEKARLSRENFKRASFLTKNIDAGLVAAAMEEAVGTPFLWRDILMLEIYGKATELTDQNEVTWKGRRVLYRDIQQLLASIGIDKGSMLIRTDDGWIELLPGPNGNVLTMDATSRLPVWDAPSGGGTGAALPDGQLWLGSAVNTAQPQTVSGDGTLSRTGALWITGSGGAAFVSSAFIDTTDAANISSGILPLARLSLATNVALGVVKGDGGATVNIAADGTISARLPALADGKLWLGSVANAATAQTVSGDGTLSRTGALWITSSGGAAFVSSAFIDTTDAANISSGILPLARLSKATNVALGIVKGDGGVTVNIAADGTISALAGGPIQNTGALDMEFLGDGSDGNVTVNGALTLTRDMYYDTLTLGALCAIDPAGWQIFCKTALDLTNAPTGAIKRNGGNGSNAFQSSGGAGGAALTSLGSLAATSGASAGSNGANGGTGAGLQANATSGASSQGGLSAASGAGGNVGATAGGASRAAGAVGSPLDIRRLTTVIAGFVSTLWTKLGGGVSAPGGSSGAGDGTGTGGGGGGGGAGGGVIFIAARTIIRGANVNASIIQVKGGDGGNPASGTGGVNRGGGGSGAGGGGGMIFVIYRTLTGAAIVGALDATGGNAPAGAAGVGTGQGGDSGGGGGGGRISIYDLGAGTATVLNASAAVPGNAHVAGAGGLAKAANAQKADI